MKLKLTLNEEISQTILLLKLMLVDKNKKVIKHKSIQNVLDIERPLRVGNRLKNIAWGDWWLNVYTELIFN